MVENQVKSLNLRDQLAVHRTHMANERTLMAYIRTAFMLFAGGVTLIKIYDHSPSMKTLGVSLLPLALTIAVFSIIRFLRMKCRINNECSRAK